MFSKQPSVSFSSRLPRFSPLCRHFNDRIITDAAFGAPLVAIKTHYHTILAYHQIRCLPPVPSAPLPPLHQLQHFCPGPLRLHTDFSNQYTESIKFSPILLHPTPLLLKPVPAYSHSQTDHNRHTTIINHEPSTDRRIHLAWLLPTLDLATTECFSSTPQVTSHIINSLCFSTPIIIESCAFGRLHCHF